MNIQGKVALITGASRGIGKAIALALAQRGIKRLMLVARDRQKLTAVANQIEAMGVETIILSIDLTKTVEVNIAIAQLWRNYGPIHLLVNCAGVAYQTSFLQTKLPRVQEELSVNLLGMYNLTSLIARRMVSQRQGTIVNVSSLMGKVAAPTMATYSATKFAILGFTQALRRELAEHNIAVIALLPSLTDTDMARDLKLFRWVIPMTPEQVAQVLVSGLQKDAPEILVGWQSHLAVWCQRLAPWLLEIILQIATPSTLTKPERSVKPSFMKKIYRFSDLLWSRT
ncbi:SDR family NAD(P)-dependent oxidoreductase [Umezakia ovalisporum]|jgi:3-oxoacyl-[acyl-carrier protein] reductase|uniref:SDR family NAD(P)-dependent oxidoreductase n=2 Tax=Umezakia ovalisporum TaxID=75695 RepID=A0AA43GXU2_9CYAN|nr:SDR family NAD(P)-dependent oxidoreductase [Umezakia ovalisporum]MBI1240302.1 SDR family NAD(P)-dependent oxidoreductase [Nostoc sp. RI_552]MDH6057241.1 SDR family NAD(P)-dependent oxidoreductase [Umezakia ovalisporum FSS-43]MDH6063639.1 SDR family NAD(P)-dependent oxidoreductase [Umezakia ovalisporum FSS-62]MDH6068803.1 SDR family NAD(P)-dependent oxidoreductase [Umezakia ovalisporum APH033B]MDH6070292.1 SDR family NAD(P)-dependent oxidoreductase [Umezakia ovalisporum CobakiLakeA]